MTTYDTCMTFKRVWTTMHLLRPGIISGPGLEKFEEWFKSGSRKPGSRTQNIFGNVEFRAVEPLLHAEQMNKCFGVPN